MNSNDLSHAFSILILLPVALSAQAADRDVVPLKNWPAPLYWQPTQAETQATAAAPDAVRPTAGVGDATSSPSPLVFVGITPCRAVDTRADRGFTGAFGPPSLAASASRTFPIQSSSACSIPSVAQAYSINVTVVPKGPLGFMKIYPTGQAQPPSGTLNSPQGF